ncbi:M1 family metallopeptidase [Mucilaginibacter koreensis]
MQLKTFCAVLVLAASAMQLKAQTLYMPRDVKRAYQNGTRSLDGRPGARYWQNTANYDIHVTALPPDRNIRGTEQIVYTNNSPDTLKRLNMKLILNIHRPGAPRSQPASPNYLTPGVQIDTFAVEGKQIRWNNDAASSTNQAISLPKPLLPHTSVKLNIAWHYQISLESGREGMIDSTTYYLAYFYPRVSVYDDYNGWDRIAFTDGIEFYNDFNNYKLSVTVPKNYLVWATGTLQNTDEVLQPEYAKRLKKSMTSDSTIHVATAADLQKQNITRPNATNTWLWTAENITDVALGLSNHYVWDAASVVVDKNTKRRASMQAAFKDDAADFHQSVQFGRNSLSWFSNNWPGVPYPFPKMTSFQGFADMEYPMMVNDSHTEDPHFSQFVQDHEIAHTYFPFYMGINESHYGFMDEGWATTFELLIGTSEVGKEQAEKLYKGFRVNGYINNPATYEDLPVITPTDELNRGAGNNEYGKPSLSYLALKDMLGDALFKKALHTYMDNWHGKHPIPWDYFNSMSSGSGQNLNWFFNNWFFTNNYIDIAVKTIQKTNNGYVFNVENVGGFAIPFDVKLTYADGSTEVKHQTPAVWAANQKQTAVNIATTKTLSSITLDGGIFMDATEKDNTFVVK